MWPFKSKPKVPVLKQLLTEVPADYAMMLNILELSTLEIQVRKISDISIELQFGVKQNSTFAVERKTRFLYTGDVLSLNGVLVPSERARLQYTVET